jgi:hypothetical protein
MSTYVLYSDERLEQAISVVNTGLAVTTDVVC